MIVTKPRWSSAPYKPSPARREFIHGPIRPMDEPSKSEARFITYGLITAIIFVFAWSGWNGF